MRIWTVYRNPTDYPDKFVARLFEGTRATGSIVIADDIETLRNILQFEMQLVRFDRSPQDEPQIVESWL